MRTRWFRFLVLAGLAAMLAHVDAQTDPTGATMLAPIVSTERAGAGMVRIVYDLRGASGTTVAIALEASSDGGRTFTIRPRTVTGDIGASVTPGGDKTIVWDTTKDVEDLQIDRFVFRVVVSPARQPAPPSSTATPVTPPTASAPVGGGSSTSKPSGGTTTGAKTGGGMSRGAIIGIAGGAAAGVGVAVAKGKGSSPGPNPGPVPQNLPVRTFTGPFSFQLIVVITNSDGSAACSQTFGHESGLTMTLQVSGGSVTGTAALSDRSTVLSSTCGPSAGITDAGFTAGNIPVNGTPASLVFTREIIDRITESGVTGTRTQTVSFSGVLTAETISGTLTLRYQGEGGVGASGQPRISLGTTTTSVTLR